MRRTLLGRTKRFDGVWDVPMDAVTEVSEEEKNPWYYGVSVYALEAYMSSRETGPSWLFPRFVHDTMSRISSDEALLFDEWVERIQREGMNVLLIVTADDHGYVVIDDEHEDLKYRAWRSGWRDVLDLRRSFSQQHVAIQDALVDTALTASAMASADLCGRLETDGAPGPSLRLLLERPATRPDVECVLRLPWPTPLTRRQRV